MCPFGTLILIFILIPQICRKLLKTVNINIHINTLISKCRSFKKTGINLFRTKYPIDW